MNHYQQKRADKIERFKQLAEQARQRSQSNFEASNRISDFIPLGQPILVGHHSERRHRKDVQRIENLMTKTIEESKKEAYYIGKAQAAQNNTAINSDDPEAITLLKDKISKLKAKQERMKLINKAHKDYLKNPASINKYNDLTQKEINFIITYTPQYSFEPHPFPPYAITNNGGNIRTAEKRLIELENKRAKQTTQTETPEGITIIENVEANRLQIFFPSKPDEETRTKLKRAGFKWSPTNECWQNYLSNSAIYAANLITHH